MNDQQMFWQGSGGDKYITRNMDFHNFEYTDGFRKDILKYILKYIPRDISILELGCSKGQTIGNLKEFGFTNITGVDINESALKIAREEFPRFDFIESAVEDYNPTKKFDMVITSGLLIHIHQDNLPNVISKIRELSKKYIFGFEYYSKEFERIDWPGYCYSGDYAKLFALSGKTEIHKTISGNLHMFYLLEK